MENTSKLFSDSETFQKERPLRITAQQYAEVIDEIAKRIICFGNSDSDKSDIISDLTGVCFQDSGYEIAKYLECYGAAEYEIDADFIELLEWIEISFSKKQDDNVRCWVIANEIKPKLNKGAKVILTKSTIYDFSIGTTVFVNSIDLERARYSIALEKDSNTNRVVKFETLEAII
ncbi:hypothetical protein [Tenacibaculum piscium]|uniref:hypothetical protein n=1 Tax=Tenacibaculum piscium TaxID=1458515 RepID=UPI001F3930DB|nr:hypothetical protein [Tenacibaculum piscium]